MGVRRVNVSLDTRDADKFREITRWGDFDKVMAGIDAAQAAGLHTIWYNGQGETWTGGERADAEVSDLRDLAAAVAAIDANVSAPPQ